VVFDSASNLYGTTQFSSGDNYDGMVYELMPSDGGWKETAVYNFRAGAGGAQPYAGVIFDNAGNLYGTTLGDGSYNCGVVFQLTPSGSGWTENILYSFNPSDGDGCLPTAGVIFDQSGNLYGATLEGGSGGGGTVFELTPSNGSWTYNVLYSFNGSCGPSASLVMDGKGNLYGTTVCDGSYGYGNVFKLTPSGSSWAYTSLYDFTGGSDGARPSSNVVFDTAGNLYGTTSEGGYLNYCATGGSGCGVVWEITP
jgi:uncharacterized repeat protein (TIGR03803 family)